MNLPFTTEQFLEVFKNYNLNVYPLQFIFYLLAVFIVFLSARTTKNSNRMIVFILSFFFMWTGIVYHILHFTAINRAAFVFGGAFVFQSLVLMYYGLYKHSLKFRIRRDVYGITGSVFVIYALIIYPALGYLNDHEYPSSPTFGVPCPTLIFTYGIFLWTEEKLPKSLLIVPFVWAIIGFSAVSLLGMIEDLGLFISAVVTTIMIFVRDKRRAEAK